MDKPNILLITTDTSRCDTLACYGNPRWPEGPISPNLDRLAAEGVTFENAHTSSPVCMPARVSLLTGVHTPVHGAIENGIERRTHLTVFPDLLKAQGYTNILVGKAHFGPVPASFDVQRVLQGEKNSGSHDFYAHHLRAHGYSRATNHPNPVPEDLFSEAFLVDTTIQEIERAVNEKREPFFAFCSMLSPHEPFDPPGRWANLYDNRSLPPLNYSPGDLACQPVHLRRLLGYLGQEDASPAFPDGEPDHARIDACRRLYYGLAAYCDAQIGRLLSYLDERGLRENTLVIYTSDHGTALFDHGFADKHNFYDETWRVPLIMSLPGTLPRGERRDFAIWNDLTATILAAAGTSCPTVQGFDLFTPLRDGRESPRRAAVATLYKSCALATKRWKLEYYFEEGTGRLFDRETDPREQTDLYAVPDYREVRDALRHALLTWRADLLDVQDLQASTTANEQRGGPVARRMSVYTRQMRGSDAEQRLNERVERIDSLR
ncbi:MAG TPA: sulfatase-like hydrolase/transferase [Chloroflexota bacterium]|nr:sulfatase-like hydrolase/transferase [Chloroflexota bacterium]